MFVPTGEDGTLPICNIQPIAEKFISLDSDFYILVGLDMNRCAEPFVLVYKAPDKDYDDDDDRHPLFDILLQSVG